MLFETKALNNCYFIISIQTKVILCNSIESFGIFDWKNCPSPSPPHRHFVNMYKQATLGPLRYFYYIQYSHIRHKHPLHFINEDP